jgi:hypothetical protein
VAATAVVATLNAQRTTEKPTGYGVRELAMRAHVGLRVKGDDIDGSAIGSACIITSRANDELWNPVLVQVADAQNGAPKPVESTQRDRGTGESRNPADKR